MSACLLQFPLTPIKRGIRHGKRFQGNHQAPKSDDILKGDHKDGDTFYGLGGNDTIRALNGNDFIFGGNGNDKIYAAGGDDQIWAGYGNDFIDGGAGNDTVAYTDMTGAATARSRPNEQRRIQASMALIR